jgi:hypothetical protein
MRGSSSRSSRREGKPLNVRISAVDILTFNGFFDLESDILKPRWLLTQIFPRYLKTYKDLDYVASWLVKAAEYSELTQAASAFVTTNSICQSEQVGMLWPILFGKRQKLFFAHTSFIINEWAIFCKAQASTKSVSTRKRETAPQRLRG